MFPLVFFVSCFVSCICTCTFRAETEVEGAGKLSGQDKALLSAVWIPAVVYALMSDQVDDDGDKFFLPIFRSCLKVQKEVFGNSEDVILSFKFDPKQFNN